MQLKIGKRWQKRLNVSSPVEGLLVGAGIMHERSLRGTNYHWRDWTIKSLRKSRFQCCEAVHKVSFLDPK